jgi:hypothetical protein
MVNWDGEEGESIPFVFWCSQANTGSFNGAWGVDWTEWIFLYMNGVWEYSIVTEYNQ